MASATNRWRVGFFFGVNYIHTMQFPSRLIRGTLIQRYQRFLADVRVASGAIVTAHCTNTGSMMGCKAPGSAVYISRSNKEGRRLLYTWEMIRVDGGWVGINTLHPNRPCRRGNRKRSHP
jgi:sugar fermentation stimulation protein A